MTDVIECKVTGIKAPVVKNLSKRPPTSTSRAESQPNDENDETVLKVEGCDTYENAYRVKECLRHYGEILSELTLFTNYQSILVTHSDIFQSYISKM